MKTNSKELTCGQVDDGKRLWENSQELEDFLKGEQSKYGLDYKRVDNNLFVYGNVDLFLLGANYGRGQIAAH